MLEEFKKFALRGNVVDLAVGVIIGGAFGKIVSSLVNDIIMPLLGLILGRIDLTSLKIVLRPATLTNAELALRYGQFLQNALDFLVISFSIFMVLRVVNKMHKKEEEKPEPPAPPAPSKEEQLLTEIRDLLKQN
ncbi:MAG: large-conductance mechanosensitive channel protein MscL [Firmicutes bacterium]|nr:large-conductance mechanosensitive channel protein MscL [Bacillota bacterium]